MAVTTVVGPGEGESDDDQSRLCSLPSLARMRFRSDRGGFPGGYSDRIVGGGPGRIASALEEPVDGVACAPTIRATASRGEWFW
jgi:hypothetical protein